MHWKTVGEHLGLQCSTEMDSECFKILLKRWLLTSSQRHPQFRPPYTEDLIHVLTVVGMKEVASKLGENPTLMSERKRRIEIEYL